MATAPNITTSRKRLNWFGWSSLLLLFPLLHFATSVFLWLTWWGATIWNPALRSRIFEEVSREFMCFAPALFLFVLSCLAYWYALKGRAGVWRLLVIIMIGSIAFFWTDVHFLRYQVNVEFATQEYWDNGGLHQVYFTWWWYNDLWFK